MASELPPQQQTYTWRQMIGLGLGAVLFVVFLLMPEPGGMSPQAKRAAAVAVLMATWWISEALPIPAVALLPLLLYPALRVMDAKAAAAPYADHNIYLFMGGFFIAMAMQKWGLHRRIALHVIGLLGTSPRRLILGFMIATAAISMWISDTATAMMMTPIALAVIYYAFGERPAAEVIASRDRREVNFATALMLLVAHASVIGGIATLVGTPPNLVFKGQVQSLFPQAPEVAFSQWMLVGLPVAVALLPLSWLWVTVVALPIGLRSLPGSRQVIRDQLREMGTMSRGEKVVLAVFVCTVLAWLTRANVELGAVTVPGWAPALGVEKYVTDSTVAIAAGLLLFALPVDWRRNEFALDWEWARRLPWGILILFGGGFSLAASFRETGLSEWIGLRLAGIGTLPPLGIVFATCVLLTFLTEITSNTATATVMMPVLAALATAMGVHPFLLMMPAAMSCSCAFMLPVATPPNAIVFGSGYVDIPHMAKAGVGLNMIGAVVITAAIYFIAVPVFGISPTVLPEWVQ
ncbi:MAG: SLC13 family permease [Armatimonadota bacterium]